VLLLSQPQTKRTPQSLKVIYSEDPAALGAMTEVLLLYEQARSLSELASSYSHSLADAAQSAQMFGDSLQRLAAKRDPRTETLWAPTWRALSLEQLLKGGGPGGQGGGQGAWRDPPPDGAPLPEGLSTQQQLLHVLGAAQQAAAAQQLSFAESSSQSLSKTFDALRSSYASDVKPSNDTYMESKRRWRYSLQQAAAHRHAPEEAQRFEQEAVMWRRQWENASLEVCDASRKVVAEHAPKVTKALAGYVQAQLKAMGRMRDALQREEYRRIDVPQAQPPGGAGAPPQ
jgi:hypothetical protein